MRRKAVIISVLSALALGGFLFLMIGGVVAGKTNGTATSVGNVQTGAQTRGPVTTEEQAIAIAKGDAKSWGEPNPVVVSVTKPSRGEWTGQMISQGENVRVAASGPSLWRVQMQGAFTPNRGGPQGFNNSEGLPTRERRKYPYMHVVIDAESGSILNAGVRWSASAY